MRPWWFRRMCRRRARNRRNGACPFRSISAAARIAPLVENRGFQVGIQGHPNMHSTTPDAISTPENYEVAVSLSKSDWVSLISATLPEAGMMPLSSWKPTMTASPCCI
jgi:hypothetical protein